MEEESDRLPVCPCAVYSTANTAASGTTMVASSIDFSHPSTVTLSRNLGIESTRLLFMGNNFQSNDQDVFHDCEDSPTEGRSDGPSRCQLDDPAAIRDALERAANATQMLLKNFDKQGWNQPTAVTLELTARLVDPKKSRTGCPQHGKPVTVQMPLEFNSQSGKMANSQQRKMVTRKARKGPVCQCRSQGRKNDGPMRTSPTLPNPDSGKSPSEQFLTCDSVMTESVLAEQSRSAVYIDSCGDSTSRSYGCNRLTCRNRYDPEAREVISICYLPVPEPEDCISLEPEVEVSLLQEKVEEEEVEVEEEEEVEVDAFVEEETHLAILGSDSEPEYSTDSTESSQETEREILQEPQPKAETPTSKRYFLALPQNKDFSNCSPCRYDPSPIMDEEGNVFCPGHCGCCMCPWMKRSLATNWEHMNVKVCRCVQRGTIFTNFDDREVCSQASYFDFCPCREKAEAKYLELYSREMWSRPDAIRGREIQLSEIKELAVPIPHPTE